MAVGLLGGDEGVPGAAAVGGFGVPKAGAVVAFDDGERAAGAEGAFEFAEGGDGVVEMFEDETDEDVVEGGIGKAEAVDVGLFKRDPLKAGGVFKAAGRGEGFFGDVDAGKDRLRAALQQQAGLGSDAATGLQHLCAGGIGRVGVQDLFQYLGLLVQTLRFACGIAVYVCHKETPFTAYFTFIFLQCNCRHVFRGRI